MAIRPITDTLRRIGRGTFIDRISTELARLVLDVEENGKPGNLVLTIRVSKANRGGAVIVEGKSELKLAKVPADDALMWAGPEGNLLEADPNQRELELRVAEVPGAGSPLKTANA